MKEKGTNKIKKFVVWITLLFMPLSTYATPINGITYGDALLMLATIILLYNIGYTQIKLNKVISWELIFYIMFILINSCIFWIVKTNELKVGLLSVLRYILYILWVSISAKNYFDLNYAYKIYKFLAIIFAIYCIMQFLAFGLFNKVLPINVLGLPKVDYIENKYSEETMDAYTSGTVMFRPYSVFIEPAYFAVYEIPILYLVLNELVKKEKKGIKYLFGIIITVALVMTGSTTGIILLLFCWFKPIMQEMKNNYKSIILIMLAFIIIGYYLINSPFMDKVFGRMINEDGTLGQSVMGRIGNFHILFDGTYTFIQLLFGQGMWVETDYLPSYGRIVIAFGWIGMFYILAMLAYTYNKANKIGRSMIILLLIMFIGTNTLFNISSVLMFTLIYSNMKGENKSDGNLQERILYRM